MTECCEVAVTLQQATPVQVVVQPQAPVLITLGAEQGPSGPEGPEGPAGAAGDGTHHIVVNFSFGDATPALLGNVPAGKRVLQGWINIVTAFDGIGAALTVGSVAAPGDLLAADANLPSLVASYEFAPNVAYLVDTDVFLTIVPGSGATQGSGQVVLQIET